MEKRRVIVDVDVGADDYLALLMLLNSEKSGEIKIEAITCTMGNTTVDNVAKNVIRLLETLNRTDIPVYKGATKQLIPPDETPKPFFGTDGLCDLQYDNKPNLNVIKSEPAAVILRDLMLKYPNEISVICLAALTNLALAVRLDEEIGTKIKDVWIMGGNYTAVGNVTASAEYNFYVDPEAVFIVLETIKKPIYILTWETCLLTNITFDWRYNVFGIKDHPTIQLLNRVEKIAFEDFAEQKWIPCDAYVAAAYLHPRDIILQKNTHYASIELHGSVTRGQVVLDRMKKSKPNVTIIEKINCTEFKKLLMKL